MSSLKVALQVTGLVCGLSTSAFGQGAAITELSFAGIPATLQGGGGYASGAGDLDIQVVCGGGGYGLHPDDWVFVTLTLYVEGIGQVAQQVFSGRGVAAGAVNAWVPASGQNRYVYCLVQAPAASADVYGTILGSGPNSTILKISSFIPYEYVGNPFTIGIQLWEGDNRSFSYYGGTSRTTQIYEVLNPGTNDGDVLNGPYHEAGLSVSYDRDTSVANPPFGSLTPEARDDWTPGFPMKLEWGFADTSGMYCGVVQRMGTAPQPQPYYSSHWFACSGSVSVPLAFWAPPIRWELEIELSYGLNVGYYQVNGCTGYFPSFEAYANGVEIFALPDTGEPEHIVYGCARSVSRSGYFQ